LSSTDMAHRGDGRGPTRRTVPVFVPISLPRRKPSRLEAGARQSGSPASVAHRPRAPSASSRSASISRLRRCAIRIGRRRATGNGSASSSSQRLRKPASTPTGALVDAHGEGRRRATVPARAAPTTSSKSGCGAAGAPNRGDQSLPGAAPSLDGAARRPGGLRKCSAGAKPWTSSDRDRAANRLRRSARSTPARMTTLAQLARQAPAGADHPPWRTGLAARGADGDHGPRARPCRPGGFLQATAAARGTLAQLVDPYRARQGRGRSVLRSRTICVAVGRNASALRPSTPTKPATKR